MPPCVNPASAAPSAPPPRSAPAAGEEVRLCLEAQQGSDAALDRMVRRHLPLVHRVARRYARGNASLDDLVNEGSIGLMRAVRKYDPRHGLPFVPYAVWWVKQAMIMFLIQHNQGSISLPIRKVQLQKRLRREEDELAARLGRTPTESEVAARLGVTQDELCEIRHLVPEYLSWDDHHAGSETGEAAEGHPAESRVDRERLRNALEILVEDLPHKDRAGVRLYFGLAGGSEIDNYADLGRTLSMTREGARQMIQRSLRRLRSDPRAARLTGWL